MTPLTHNATVGIEQEMASRLPEFAIKVYQITNASWKIEAHRDGRTVGYALESEVVRQGLRSDMLKYMFDRAASEITTFYQKNFPESMLEVLSRRMA